MTETSRECLLTWIVNIYIVVLLMIYITSASTESWFLSRQKSLVFFLTFLWQNENVNCDCSGLSPEVTPVQGDLTEGSLYPHANWGSASS